MEELEQRHKKEQKELLGNDPLNVLDKIKKLLQQLIPGDKYDY